MLVKLIMLGVQTMLSIFAAEKHHGRGAGPLKKAEVLRTVESQAVHLGVRDEEGGCDFTDFLRIVDDLVDDVVALLNCFGLLVEKK